MKYMIFCQVDKRAYEKDESPNNLSTDKQCIIHTYRERATKQLSALMINKIANREQGQL